MFGCEGLDGLEAAIAGLALPVDLDVHRRLAKLCDRLEAARVAHAGELDAAGLWELEGATSMTAWLRSECRAGGRVARRTTTLAFELRELPVLAKAWHDGSLSRGQVDAIVANIGHHRERFAHDEAELVPALVALGVDDTMRAMQAWKAKADALDDGPPPADTKASKVQLSETLDGRGVLTGELDPDLTQLARTALRTAEHPDPDMAPSIRRAEALREIFTQFLDAQGVAYSKRHRRHRPHLNLIVQIRPDGELGGRYVDGPPVDPATLDTLMCDSRLHRVLVDPDRGIVGYGRAVRTIPVDLFNALVVRDEHCRWPGCDRKASWCEGHHVVWWDRGGPTDLHNLVLLCRRHHHRLHTNDPTTRRLLWEVHLAPDGTFTTTRTADGLTRTSRPPGLTPKLW